jgi:serine/threonine-protein kinase RsbT
VIEIAPLPSSQVEVVTIRMDGDIVDARRAMRELAAPLGFSSAELAMMATAVSELARNILVYAETGEIEISPLEQAHRRGIQVEARDEGPGIADVQLALSDGYSTANSLGLGLPGARRLMDEFEIESQLGVGTVVTLRKWSSRW